MRFDAAWTSLRDLGLDAWVAELEGIVAGRVAPGAHGDLADWQAAIAALPALAGTAAVLDGDAVGITGATWPAGAREAAESALRSLSPWRKGPFDIDGIVIDSEWRSNLKWDRVAAAVDPLEGRRVLDVGCGNGYYALRMQGAGAATVIGIDPTLRYVAQFRAIAHFVRPAATHVLPLRLDELPAGSQAFDTAFSMGVLYHTRAPVDHLRQLRDALCAGGQVVLETLVLPGSEACSRTPPDRYARMRNVWHLPTVPELLVWMSRAGLVDARVVDTAITTVDEQRTTAWMPFESLAEALDPADPALTVEGWPRPCRAIVVARAPGQGRT